MMDNLDAVRAETLRQEKEREAYLARDDVFRVPGYDSYQLSKVYTCDMSGYSEVLGGAWCIEALFVL